MSKHPAASSSSQPSLSRASSTGSLQGGGGGGQSYTSAPNTDGPTDDEDSDSKSTMSYKERRREAHTAAEQKRRDAIKKGYDYLQDLVPTCVSSSSGSNGGQQTDGLASAAQGHKVSKATVLQKSIDYIQYVQQQKKKQEDELSSLRKEVIALQIMRANYEQLVRMHQSQPNPQEFFVPSEIKFQVFQLLMDSLFQSFNESVSMNNFSELSGCVFSWLEEQCKPPLLQELMYNILQQVRHTYNQPMDKKPVRTSATALRNGSLASFASDNARDGGDK